jgi:hypothetical protein
MNGPEANIGQKLRKCVLLGLLKNVKSISENPPRVSRK